MVKSKNRKTERHLVTLDGMMTVGRLENGRHRADFQCCEVVETEKFTGLFRLQCMHDGNFYMEERPKRIKNKPLFRQDNSSVSLGRNGQYYFVFWMPEDEVELMPEKLVEQASEAAAKVSGMVYGR